MASNNARTDFFTMPFECRAVWHNLATKRTRDFNNAPLPPDKQYYDVTLLIPKTAADASCQNYQFLAQRLMPLIGKQPGWNGQWPPEGRWPIEDCDKPDFVGKYPWAARHWRIAPWADIPPRVLDQGNNDIPKTLTGDGFTGFKSGDYCFASVNAFAWSTNKGGISMGVEGIKKTRDGDPVGSGQRSVEQMFGGAPTGQPMYAAPGAGPPPPPQPSLPPGYAPQPAQFQPGHQSYGTSAPPTYPQPGPAPQVSSGPPAMPQQQQPAYQPPLPPGYTPQPPNPTYPPTAGPYPGPATGPYAPGGPAPQALGPATPYPSNPLPGNPVAPPQYGAAPPPGYPQSPPPIGYR